jgi:pyrroline-5-carboxylate reductase
VVLLWFEWDPHCLGRVVSLGGRMKKIAFIGGGNMAQALVKGLVDGGYDADCVWVANRSKEKLVVFENEYKVFVTSDNSEAVAACELIVLAVKPQQMQSVCEGISAALHSNHVVISLAAGIGLKRLSEWLPPLMLFRAMPNLAVSMGQGVIGFLAEKCEQVEIKTVIENIFQRCGLCVWLENDRQLNALTSVAASGMAFYCLLSECLTQQAKFLGLPFELAEVIIQKTELGAALLAAKTPGGASSLRSNITSSGGTTEAALNCFYKGGFNGMVKDAVSAAINRADELNKG